MSILSNDSFIRVSANISTILFGLVIILQLLLAAGILPVTMAWGGQFSELMPALRFASLAAVVVLAVFAYVVRRRAGLIEGASVTTLIVIASWIITGFMALNTLGNLTSQSNGEKILFSPITFLLFIFCLVVSMSKT
jgi:hypothetical protein